MYNVYVPSLIVASVMVRSHLALPLPDRDEDEEEEEGEGEGEGYERSRF